MAVPELQRIEGKYEILEKMREGGMGALYKVRHRLLDELRVVKVIRPQLDAEEGLKERFLAEARSAVRLRHPNVAALFDFSIDEDGVAFMVIEFIDGEDLGRRLSRKGPLPAGVAVEVTIQALRALEYLHRNNFVHRDISPDNLMLTRDVDGDLHVKLIDLGVAKELESDANLTREGYFLGKIKYASPEQFGGAGELDARSDLYSLGVVLYEVLTGGHPYGTGSQQELVAGHLFKPPKPFAETDPDGRVPEGLRRVILKAMEKAPAERYPDAAAMAAELVELQREIGGVELPDIEGDPTDTLVFEPLAPGSTQERLDREFAPVSTHPPTPAADAGSGGDEPRTALQPSAPGNAPAPPPAAGEAEVEGPVGRPDAERGGRGGDTGPAERGADAAGAVRPGGRAQEEGAAAIPDSERRKAAPGAAGRDDEPGRRELGAEGPEAPASEERRPSPSRQPAVPAPTVQVPVRSPERTVLASAPVGGESPEVGRGTPEGLGRAREAGRPQVAGGRRPPLLWVVAGVVLAATVAIGVWVSGRGAEPGPGTGEGGVETLAEAAAGEPSAPPLGGETAVAIPQAEGGDSPVAGSVATSGPSAAGGAEPPGAAGSQRTADAQRGVEGTPGSRRGEPSAADPGERPPAAAGPEATATETLAPAAVPEAAPPARPRQPPPAETPKPEPVAPVEAAPAEPSPAPPTEPVPTPRPEPIVTPAAELPAIQQALRTFAEAHEARDVVALQGVWPSLSGARLDALRDSFAGARSIEMKLGDCTIRVLGVTANATCELRQVYVPQRGNEQRIRRSARFTLAKRGAGWIIESF